MVGAIGNVVHAEHDLARQLPLESQIPLVNVGVSRRGRAQVVIVGIPPIRQCAILRALRTGKAGGKRVGHGGNEGLTAVERRHHIRVLGETVLQGVLQQAVPGYWKLVAGLIPKYTPAPPRRTVFELNP